MTHRTPRILAVGAATLDTIFRLDELPTGSGKYVPLEAITVAAGMASSAAMQASRLGVSASLCACVGDDAQGDRLLAEFMSEGLDCTHVRRVRGGRSAFCTILVDAKGERIIVPCYDPDLLADTAWLPVEQIGTFDALLTDVRWPAAAAIMLKAARANNVPSVLDADVAPISILRELVPLASHCVFSEPAALSYTDTESAAQAATQLALRFPTSHQSVTAGAQGCWWYDVASSKLMNFAAPEVAVVDTLSAGDSFHGAFAAGVSERLAIPDIIAWANAAAALKCTRFGGRLGAPTKTELDDLFERTRPR